MRFVEASPDLDGVLQRLFGRKRTLGKPIGQQLAFDRLLIQEIENLRASFGHGRPSE
jgi:hypothetical protein